MSMSYTALWWQQQHEDWEIINANRRMDIEASTEEKILETNNSFVDTHDIWEDGLAMLETNQFFALSIVGPQGSGKTSVARQFAQLALEEDFKVIYALPDDFIKDVQGWSDRTLDPPCEKTCIILDDLSYALDMSSRKNQSLMKNIVARLRHIYKGQIFVIFITHRLHATPPMLRNSGSWFFTNMQSADRDDSLEVIGKSADMKNRLEGIYQFIADATITGAKKGYISFTLSGKKHEFKWGRKGDPGDGRLMAIYHAGQLKVFNSKLNNVKIDLNEYRYPPPPELEVEN